MQNQIAALSKQVQNLTAAKTKSSCAICCSMAHTTEDCPTSIELEAEANMMNTNWRKLGADHYNQVYNPNWRQQHPGFQWSNPQGGQYASTSAPYQPPHMRQPQNQYQPPQQATNAPKKPSLEDMFATFMEVSQQNVVQTQNNFQNLQNSISKLELQMGQIATTLSTREPGRFPSQPEVNPRKPEQAKAMITLRSGKVINNKVGETTVPIDNEYQEEKNKS